MNSRYSRVVALKTVNPSSLIPNIRLFGPINDGTLAKFLDALATIGPEDPIVLELTTTGGDAEIGRRIALECMLLVTAGRDAYFVGKSSVMSAGITIMSAFPVERRFLDDRCQLMIHERQIQKDIKLAGPLRGNLQTVKAALAELEAGIRIEEEDFNALVKGSRLSFECVQRKVAESNWYLTAEEALGYGLIARTL